MTNGNPEKKALVLFEGKIPGSIAKKKHNSQRFKGLEIPVFASLIAGKTVTPAP